MFDGLLRHDMSEGRECSTIPAAASSYSCNSLEHVLEIEEEFAFRVLGDGGGYRVSRENRPIGRQDAHRSSIRVP